MEEILTFKEEADRKLEKHKAVQIATKEETFLSKLTQL